MSLKRYRLDELYNIAYETNRKEKQMNDNMGCLFLIIIFAIAIGMAYGADYLECSATAKTLEYQSEYNPFTGCVLTKPNGKKVLLKQLRDYGE